MRAIYRTTFELRGIPPQGEILDAFADAVWRWIFDRKELGLVHRPPGALGPVTLGSCSPTAATRVESIRAEFGGQLAWGVVYSQAEQQSPELHWVSDLALIRNPDGKHYFSFSQFIGRQDGGMIPFRRNPGRPRIIRTLVHDFAAYSGGLRLWTSPFPIRNTEVDIARFIEILESSKRTHPVVLVSVHAQSRSYFINPMELADHLSGIAHVVVAENAQVTRALSDLLPRSLTCFDGAIRVYWPGFRRISSTLDHRIWTVEDLSRIQFDSGRFADLVLADIAAVSVNSISPYYASFERIQSLDRRRVIALAKDNEDWREMAELYADDNASKDARIASLERELKEKTEALFHEQQLTATLRSALDDRKRGGAGTAEEQIPVESVADAIARAQERLAGQITFALNSRSDADSVFGSPEEVWCAFEWLATTYYRAMTKMESCPDFSASVAAAISGWDYSRHQKEATMKANEEWYRCTYNGQRLWIPEHLRSGSSRDASESIRIAFCWDEPTRRVVIGYIGLHQKNTKT